ncbi:unnamed protein product [Linum tenue]|uniref:Uncharacterized protein n=1 Tax=Linum tenue TaxID=586396 RepID=A0AAV0H5L7_9ROSI|nr:unnamed protein product [Linum tenue]
MDPSTQTHKLSQSHGVPKRRQHEQPGAEIPTHPSFSAPLRRRRQPPSPASATSTTQPLASWQKQNSHCFSCSSFSYPPLYHSPASPHPHPQPQQYPPHPP